MKKIVFILFFLSSLFVYGQNDFEKANEFYKNKQYREAADLYQKIIEEGWSSFALYYNLGNSSYKLNELANAALNYEKAKLLKPHNQDVKDNLKILQTKLKDKIEPLPVPFYAKWKNTIQNLFSLKTWAILSILFFVFVLIAILFIQFSPKILYRKAAFWKAILFLLLFIFSLFFAFQSNRNMTNSKKAIIFEPSIAAKSSPDTESTMLFVIHEGTKVSINDQVDEWIKIKLANGKEGWIEENAVQKIEL